MISGCEIHDSSDTYLLRWLLGIFNKLQFNCLIIYNSTFFCMYVARNFDLIKAHERFHAKTPNGRGSKKIDLDEIAFFLLATF